MPDLVELEYLCLTAARLCGIAVPKAELFFPASPIMCVSRFDRTAPSGRTASGLVMPIRRHQEDMAQALGVSSGSKYAELEPSTASVIAEFLTDRSATPALDIASFVRLILFNYAIGNCDNHLKNYSILYSENWSAIRFAPAYDLVSTAHYRSFSTEMGLRIGSTRTLETAGFTTNLASVNGGRRLSKLRANELGCS